MAGIASGDWLLPRGGVAGIDSGIGASFAS